MTEFQYELKIPKDRIAVLIGKQGQIKKEIEETTKTKIEVDSNEGDIFCRGEDGLGLYNAKEVITAIGRGFNPEVALLLLKPDYALEIIEIKNYAGKSKETMQRLKGRVIGREGKSRSLIEELTGCNVCVYGKTITIVGETGAVAIARRAVEALLSGSTHAAVYSFLEKQRRVMKRKEMMGGI